ncbi:MAG: lipid A biosynthesis acyltransferase, partial [Moraxellaceae bacterium]
MDKRSPPTFHSSFYYPRYWLTWFGIGFFYVLGNLPMSVTMPFGRFVGDLFFFFAGSRRRITEINISTCFPQLSSVEQASLVRKIMHSTGKSMVETSIALWGRESQLKNRYIIRGLEHIEAARQQGLGVLLVGCHLTTLDVAGRILSFHVKYDMLYRKDPNPLLAYKLIKAREGFAGSAIVRSDTRQLIKNLRQGHIVWYAPDQDFGPKHSVFAPFFGVEAATVTGTARIAQLGKAIVLPFAHYRDDATNKYEVIISAPLENYPTGDDVSDATRINQVIEASIIKQPDQYL